MKPDDFESQLQRQPLRGLPAVWRAEILSAAQEAVAQAEPVKPLVPVSWWRELLWPCPQAWAGLAAVWVVIFGLNWANNRPAEGQTLMARRELTPEERMAFIEQQRLLASLLEAQVVVSPPPPAEKIHPPRSEVDVDRRRAYRKISETFFV
ncbi:MAG: hypothetical protein K0Q55_1264 [Verrucomicrobia bacterium]|jgi:hypothetical protein|nr:hypothetical protein [Verrucomicrobiota bacterium]